MKSCTAPAHQKSLQEQRHLRDTTSSSYFGSQNPKISSLYTSSSVNIQNRLKSFNVENNSSIDDEISQFNQILKSVAEISPVPLRGKTLKKTKEKSKPWCDNTCRQLKKELRKLANKINPTAPRSLRQEYFVLKKKYEKLVKKMH